MAKITTDVVGAVAAEVNARAKIIAEGAQTALGLTPEERTAFERRTKRTLIFEATAGMGQRVSRQARHNLDRLKKEAGA